MGGSGDATVALSMLRKYWNVTERMANHLSAMLLTDNGWITEPAAREDSLRTHGS